MNRVGVRWTIGNVSEQGFEALRLSVWGMIRLLGENAEYCICTNTIALDHARELTGELPNHVRWHDASNDIPPFLRSVFDQQMAEGVGWKLAPLRMFPDRHELSLDNDCILWQLPPVLEDWLATPHPPCLMAEDVRKCFGRFEGICPDQALNAGVRGLPPGFNFEEALLEVIGKCIDSLGAFRSELDEQGLQAAALSRRGVLAVVPLADVSVCSPFWPHIPYLGRCGAHFVGINAQHIPWDYYDRPAIECLAEHWQKHSPSIYRRLRLAARHRAMAAQQELLCER